MSQVVRAVTWLAIVGIALMTQGCWEQEGEFTLLGEGGCRTGDGGDGGPKYLTGVTVEQCEARCLAEQATCVAYEYNANTDSCEIHHQPITTFAGVEGVSCYVVRSASPVSQAKL
jgi:hypothetical protein